MSEPGEQMFLARETYRRRRLMDAARFLPFVGAFVFLVPTIWGPGAGTAVGTIYIFAVWAVLIALSFILSRRLRSDVVSGGEGGAD